MADNFNWDVVIRLALQGAKQAKEGLEDVTAAATELQAAGKIAEKTFDNVSRASSKMGASAKEAGQGTDSLTRNLPRLRYALYDVSSTLTIAGAAMTALGVATFGTAISMDRAFADVARTSELYLDKTGQAAKDLRQDFNELFSTMPVSWSDLTDIGTLAGQLNIASDSVAEFTRLVAMFAATTDVSVEQSATAFGRLAELLDVPASEFENLGSSILAVGVNSVATESQIIAISTQITAMAASAGFSADEVFGLSAALASLGTQPELSRGVIVRLFSNINRAITEGGERLEKFGATARMTGAEFAQSWGDDAAGTLLRVMEGIGSKEGPAAVAALNDLGIVAARDVPTLLRLAQNSDVLAESLSVAAQGYADGTALADQYGVIAETVAEKLNVLAHNFQLLISTIGQGSGVIGFFVDAATNILRVLTALANNPVAGTVLGLATATTVLVGAFSLLAGVTLRGLAGLIAFRTVFTELAASGFAASASLSGMTSALFGISTSATSAAASVRGVSLAIKSIPVVGTALAVIGLGFQVFGEYARSARDRAEEFFGDLSGYFEALERDTAIWQETGAAIATFEVDLKSAGSTVDEAGVATKTWLGIQEDVPGGVKDATDAVTEQTFALGENADAWIRNALSRNKTVRDFANDPELRATFESLGGNIDEWISEGLAGRGTEYLDKIRARMFELEVAIPEEDIDSYHKLRAAHALLGIELEKVNSAFIALFSTATEQANVNDFLGRSTRGAADEAGDLAEVISGVYDEFLKFERSTVGLEGSIAGLGATLAENGGNWDIYTDAGRDSVNSLLSVMEALRTNAGGDAAATADAFQGLFNFLVQGGHASEQQLRVLTDAIITLGGASSRIGTVFNPASFFGGWASGAEKAAKSTSRVGSSSSSAAKKVRTLVDYARDLQGVFSRAFDLRFASSSTRDEITSTFISIREATAEAAQNIRRLKAEIQGLESDLNIQQIFLQVATQYGDTDRVQAIQANIAKLQADIAAKTTDLTDEQAKNSKVLTGNSKAAIANRKTVEGLVDQYQDHIVALASSGMGQAELARRTEQLRAQFIQQATQLGYSRTEIEKYAKSFNDLLTGIRNVPRNLTVSVNANPAIQALKEYEAALNSARSNASKGVGLKGGGLESGLLKQARAMKLLAEMTQLQMNLRHMHSSPSNVAAAKQMADRIKVISAALNSGSYADGGYTGRGGKYEPAGVVHRGEYVIPKQYVNQSTGLPHADALGKLTRGSRGPGYANGGFVGASPFPTALQVASMGPMYAQQMQGMLNEAMRVYLDGSQVSRSVSQDFALGTVVGAN